MKKIALLMVLDYENKGLERAFKKAVRRTGCEAICFGYGGPEVTAERLEDADAVFLVVDAAVGATRNYSMAAKALLPIYEERGMKPVLLVSSADKAGADISYAAMSLADAWAQVDPSLSDAETDFKTLYYSNRLRAFAFFPDSFGDSEEMEPGDVSAAEAVIEREIERRRR